VTRITSGIDGKGSTPPRSGHVVNEKGWMLKRRRQAADLLPVSSALLLLAWSHRHLLGLCLQSAMLAFEIGCSHLALICVCVIENIGCFRMHFVSGTVHWALLEVADLFTCPHPSSRGGTMTWHLMVVGVL